MLLVSSGKRTSAVITDYDVVVNGIMILFFKKNHQVQSTIIEIGANLFVKIF